MQYFNTIYQDAQNYWASIPENTSKAMATSFIIGGIIQTIVTGQPSQGAIVGTVSALAAAIHGLVTPLFREFFNRKQEQNFHWTEEMFRTATAIIGAGCVANACGFPYILKKLGAFAIVYGIWNELVPPRNKANSANPFIIG
jgi:NhaP-type Na+/H+ or K+/H+ antiporter